MKNKNVGLMRFPGKTHGVTRFYYIFIIHTVFLHQTIVARDVYKICILMEMSTFNLQVLLAKNVFLVLLPFQNIRCFIFVKQMYLGIF
jgi:hypothetical protein